MGKHDNRRAASRRKVYDVETLPNTGGPTMKAYLFPVLVAVLFSGPALASVETPHFIGEWGNTLAYNVSVPDAYAGSSHDWPVLVFMHGNGGQGTDPTGQGPPGATLWREQVIMIAPKCLSGQYWWSGVMLDAALAVVNHEKGVLRIDDDKVYVAGQSMGGYASYLITERNPTYFAAVVPISGAWGPYGSVVMPADLSPWTHLPYWHFHGRNDSTVPVGQGRTTVNNLRAGGIYTRYTEYQSGGHQVRQHPYGTQAFYDWLLAQTRNTPHNFELGVDDGNGAVIDGYHESGTGHSITARAADTGIGEVFRGWTSAAGTLYTDGGPGPVSTTFPTSGAGSFADADALTTTFTMPTNDIIVTANYLVPITNQPATGITTTSATLNATLDATGVTFDVWAFWGTTDGAHVDSAWSNSSFVGSWTDVASATPSLPIGSLANDTIYYYTFRATNGGEISWATPSATFKTMGAPEVTNGGGALPLVGQATLQGNLTDGSLANVTIYWGTSDGGTIPGNWTNDISMGQLAEGAFSTNTASGLLYGVQYYYRCYATNSEGSDWADSTVGFITADAGAGLVNTPATDITTASATLNATLEAPGSVFDVNVHWGTSDGGTTPAAWGDSSFIGSYADIVSTGLSFAATGLTGNTTYYYTFVATNAAGDMWATPAASFTTVGPPEVTNGGGATLSIDGADLHGALTAGAVADVYIYWGTADGGTDPSSWDNETAVGSGLAEGPFSSGVTNLTYGVQYYYRCYATNVAGEDWADASVAFNAPPPGVPIPGSSCFNYAFYAAAAADSLPNMDDGVTNGDNGGLFDLTPTPEASWPAEVQGKSSWTGEVWQGGNIGGDYCQMWWGYFKPPQSGAWEFYVHGDDFEILWIDVDQNGEFEAATGEDITRNVDGEEGWGVAHTETVDLVAGQYYAVAIAHREGGGGDFFNITIKEPGDVAERIDPSAAEQAGWWYDSVLIAPGAIGVSNSPPTDVTGSTATFNGTLEATNSVFDVWVYWGGTDGGDDPGAWTNSVFVGTWTDIASIDVSFPATGLSGSVWYTFRATNACTGIWAGPSINFTLDGPTPPAVSGDASPTADDTPTWTWSGTGGGAGYFRYGFAEGTWIAPDVTDTSYTPASPLTDGTYTLHVQERDSSSNWSASGTYAIVVDLGDSTAPTVSSIARADATPTNAASVDYTVTFDEDVDAATVNAGDFEVTWTSGSGAGAVSSVVEVSPDVYTVTVDGVSGDGMLRLDVDAAATVDDLAGNPLAGGYAGGDEYTIDNDPPTPPVVDGNASPTSDDTPTWTWIAGSDGAGLFRYGFAEGAWIGTDVSDTSYTPAAPLTDGTYTLHVQERDNVGNWSASGTHTIVVDLSSADADGDGLPDYWEDLYHDSGPPARLDSGAADSDGDGTDDDEEDDDGDGLTNLDEYLAGTDPTVPDSDGDGVSDGDEVSGGLDPMNPDSDGDGMEDGDEVDHSFDPADGDQDGNGIDDGMDDWDDDGVTNADELSGGTDPGTVPGTGDPPDSGGGFSCSAGEGASHGAASSGSVLVLAMLLMAALARRRLACRIAAGADRRGS
jgi:poly(3-hydroxybutyrate) depolymerase